MEEIESIQLELGALSCGVSRGKLAEFITYLEVQNTPEGKNKLQIIKFIRNIVEKRLPEPSNIDLDVFLHDSIAFMCNTPSPLEKTGD